jgi:hypothetical protein
VHCLISLWRPGVEPPESRAIANASACLSLSAITWLLSRRSETFRSNLPVIEWILPPGQELRLDTRRPYRDFEERVYTHRNNLVKLIEALTGDGKKIIGHGASTKGNLLLQFCALTLSHIPFIAQANEEKFGCFTPGTNISIISEVADP